MDAACFDPYRAERHAQWHNRLARWRAAPSQTAFHAFALIALFALLALPLARAAEAFAPIARATLARGAIWFALAAVLVLAWRHARRLAALQQRQAQEWLAPQPIAARWQARRRRNALHAEWWWQVAGGSALLALIDAAPAAFAAWVACATLALPLAPMLARRQRDSERTAGPLIARLTDPGIGRVWRWQRREAAVALRGARLAHGAWALLLVPMGSGLFVVLAVGVVGLALAMLSTAWQRSLAVLPQAQAWLSAQPWSGRRCLRESLGIPLAVLAMATALLVVLLCRMGAPAYALAGALGVVTFGGLQLACVAAYRARPRQVLLALPLHLILLLAALQSLPPLALLCWVAQIAWLLHKARQP